MITLCLSASVHPMEAFGIIPAYSEESDNGIDSVTVLQSMVFDTFLIKSEPLPSEQVKPVEENPEQEEQADTEETPAKVDIIYILLVLIGFMLLGAFMLHAKDKRKDL